MPGIDTNTSQVRITQQARAHLDKLIPAIRETRGLNVSMTDVVSEAILSIPMPEVTPTPKRRARKAALPVSTQAAVSVPAV